MRNTPGLKFDGKQWIIDKRVKDFGRIFERTGLGKEEGEKALKRFHTLVQQAMDKGQRAADGVMTFRDAAARFLKEATKRSLDRDIQILQNLVPLIGHMTLDEIHQGTLQPYIDARRKQGIRSKTVCRELAVVRRILTLASRVWRNQLNQPYLAVPPLLNMPDWEDGASPYPLSWEEQKAFLAELPPHLARLALFGLNTGLREQGLCWLRWDWEVRVPELDTSVFVVPGRAISYPEGTWPGEKNKEDQLVVLNRVSRSVIEERRSNGSEFVFDYKGKRVTRMYNTAWMSAWAEVRFTL